MLWDRWWIRPLCSARTIFASSLRSRRWIFKGCRYCVMNHSHSISSPFCYVRSAGFHLWWLTHSVSLHIPVLIRFQMNTPNRIWIPFWIPYPPSNEYPWIPLRNADFMGFFEYYGYSKQSWKMLFSTWGIHFLNTPFVYRVYRKQRFEGIVSKS